MICRLDSTAPWLAFTIAALICLIAIGVFVWEHLNPEDESSPDASHADRHLPSDRSGTPQATSRTRR